MLVTFLDLRISPLYRMSVIGTLSDLDTTPRNARQGKFDGNFQPHSNRAGFPLLRARDLYFRVAANRQFELDAQTSTQQRVYGSASVTTSTSVLPGYAK